MLFDYLMIPGFLLIVCGIMAALVGRKARSAVAVTTVIVCLLFMLGIVPVNLSTFPVALDMYNPAYRIGGFIIMGAMLAILIESFGSLGSIEAMAIMTLSGTTLSVLFADELKTRLLFAEISSLMSVFFVFRHTNDTMVRKANALFALKIFGIVSTLGAMALLATDINWFNPSTSLFGYEFTLRHAACVAMVASISIQCFAMPVSPFMTRIYSVNWPVQSLKGLVFPLLSVGAFLHFTVTMAITFETFAELMRLIGSVTIVFSAVASIAEKDKYRMLAYNMIGNIGVTMILISIGKSGTVTMYFIQCAISHICALFFVQYYPNRSLSNNAALILFAITTFVLPLAFLPPYDTFKYFAGIMLSTSKQPNICLTCADYVTFASLYLHAAASFICMFYRVFRHSGIERSNAVENNFKLYLPMIILAIAVFLANSRFIHIAGLYEIVPELAPSRSAVVFNSSTLAKHVQFYIGVFTAVSVIRLIDYLFLRKKNRTRHMQSDDLYCCSWNFDIAALRMVEYIATVLTRFFLYMATLVFDYVGSIVYNTANVCGSSDGVVSRSALRWLITLGGPSGFAVFAALSFFSVALLAFLVAC